MEFQKLTNIIRKTMICVTITSSILLLLSFMFSFDMINGYFKDGILPILFYVIFIAGILISLASAFLFDKSKIIKSREQDANQHKTHLIFATALAACALVFNFATNSSYFTISAVGTCFLAVYIALVGKNKKYSHFKLLVLLLSVAFPLAMTIDNNAVMHRHSNSVENNLTSIFAISFLIYILYEGQSLFFGAHSKWHFSSMLLLFHTGVSISASYIIAYMTYDVNERLRFYQMILILIVSVFAGYELYLFSKHAEARTQEEWSEIEEPKEPTQDEPCEPEQHTFEEEKTDE